MNAGRPVTELEDREVLAELEGIFAVTVAGLERGAALYAEVVRRGMTCSLKSVVMREYLPPIAARTLSAAAVVRFADLRRVLRAVARLPIEVQEALAAGRLVDVVMGGEVVSVSARDTFPSYVRQVFVGGKVATVEEQFAELDARRRRELARELARVERAVKRLEQAEVTTTAATVEALIAMGWAKGDPARPPFHNSFAGGAVSGDAAPAWTATAGRTGGRG
ncbi:hypothetical protein [Limnoglobus roseus]|uniref:Uncharacterized protein n=1 Tax=Limnoglobus roseus TaxID=2598579 RepID=A0A5C1AIZ0_9BACT|nr:hypothetical protein [Limnoglobus roseus]QEL18625.1 hypothetical protein PX52LOC_05658 [Limnoglobus roseus]